MAPKVKVPKELAIHQITATQLIPCLETCALSNIVPYVVSSPGLGKSDLVRFLAKKHNCKFIDVRLSTAMTEDLNGFPVVVDVVCPTTGVVTKKAIFVPFDQFPVDSDPLPLDDEGAKKLIKLRTQYVIDKKAKIAHINPTPEQTAEHEQSLRDLEAQLNKDEEAIIKAHTMNGWFLLLDELSSAPKPLQAAAYRIILDKQIGQRNLHPKVRIFAAGNRAIDSSVTVEMSKALESRLAHFELVAKIEPWIEWALANDIDHKIISYLREHHDQLSDFDPDRDERTYPCPRTWAMLSKLLKNSDPDIRKVPTYLIASVIGGTAAFAFRDYCVFYKDLPTFAEIIDDPTGTKVPTLASHQYALSFMLATNHGITADNIDKLVTYVERMNTEMQANFVSVVCPLNRDLIGVMGQDGKLTQRTSLNRLGSNILKKTNAYT